jgi:hypothetical protein
VIELYDGVKNWTRIRRNEEAENRGSECNTVD